MNIENIKVGSTLVSDELQNTSLPNLLLSGVEVIAIDDKGVRLRRRFNGEEFYLNRESLIKSHWILVESVEKEKT